MSWKEWRTQNEVQKNGCEFENGEKFAKMHDLHWAVCLGYRWEGYIGEIIKRFPCGHIFHRECAKSLMKVNKKCPVCRFDLEDFFSNLEKTGNLDYSAMHDSKIKPNPNKISHWNNREDIFNMETRSLYFKLSYPSFHTLLPEIIHLFNFYLLLLKICTRCRGYWWFILGLGI